MQTPFTRPKGQETFPDWRKKLKKEDHNMFAQMIYKFLAQKGMPVVKVAYIDDETGEREEIYRLHPAVNYRVIPTEPGNSQKTIIWRAKGLGCKLVKE